MQATSETACSPFRCPTIADVDHEMHAQTEGPNSLLFSISQLDNLACAWPAWVRDLEAEGQTDG